MKFRLTLRLFILLITGAILLIGIGIFILIHNSHYTFDKDLNKYVIEESILIDAPLTNVYQYTGNPFKLNTCLAYAEKVKVIDSLGTCPDNLGTIKRYYCHFDEQNEYWDCKTIQLIANKKRVFEVFNITGLPINVKHLQYEQRFEKISKQKSRLRLLIYFPEKNPGNLNILKAHLASYRVNSVFKETLTNIKLNIESSVRENLAKNL